MVCPFCKSGQSAVIDKREVSSRGEIRRRRECLKCRKRFTTYERVSSLELWVLKRDDRREAFDREKLKLGIQKALEKRPGLDDIESIVDKVIKRLRARGKKDVSSRLIGKVVLSELKKIDSVAYLRFVSVYRQFNDPVDFKKELEQLAV